jgi:hypothetical protein
MAKNGWFQGTDAKSVDLQSKYTSVLNVKAALAEAVKHAPR